jgi:hypothetical protein
LFFLVLACHFDIHFFVVVVFLASLWLAWLLGVAAWLLALAGLQIDGRARRALYFPPTGPNAWSKIPVRYL